MPTPTYRPIFDIAQEIRNDWKKDGKPNVWFGAVPYLNAMDSLNLITDNYGADDAKYVITYFLSNAKTWKGEVAKRVKAELNAMLKGKPVKV